MTKRHYTAGARIAAGDPIAEYRIAFLHEMAHAMDYNTDYAFTRAIAAELGKRGVSMNGSDYAPNWWLTENISQYAGRKGGAEVWSELFSLWSAGEPIPEFLRPIIERQKAPKIVPGSPLPPFLRTEE